MFCSGVLGAMRAPGHVMNQCACVFQVFGHRHHRRGRSWQQFHLQLHLTIVGFAVVVFS